MYNYNCVAVQGNGRIIAAGNGINTYAFDLGLCGFASGLVDAPEAGQVSLVARMFPNPVSKLLQVEYLLENQTSCSLSIYDASGKLLRIVFSGAVKPAGLNRESIPVSDLTGGVYFVKIEAGTKRFAGTFVRQ
jgi:hypothetical protein